MRRTAIIAAAALLTASPALAQSVDEKGAGPEYGKASTGIGDPVDVRSPAGPAPLAATFAMTPQDHYFIDRAVQINAAEIEAAQIALEKDLPPKVADYARTLIEDHEKAQDELMGLARSYDIDVPGGPSMRQSQNIDMLSNLDGDRFAEAFIDAKVTGHQQAIALYDPEENQAERGIGTNATPLEDYAEEYLPVLRKHLETAQALQAEMDGMAEAK